MKKVLFMAVSLSLCLFLSTCTFLTAKEPPDYLQLMCDSAVAGDMESGKAAQEARDALIDNSCSGDVKVSFDELYLLSKYIYSKAGSFRYSDELRMCVGEVALNRVDSPEFPDTLLDVVLDLGTGATPLSGGGSGGSPNAASVRAAMRLLLGERMMEPSVVWQTDEPRGQVYASFADKLTGFTYFCESDAPTLNEQAP